MITGRKYTLTSGATITMQVRTETCTHCGETVEILPGLGWVSSKTRNPYCSFGGKICCDDEEGYDEVRGLWRGKRCRRTHTVEGGHA